MPRLHQSWHQGMAEGFTLKLDLLSVRSYAVGCAETATQLRRLAGRALRPVIAFALKSAVRFLRRGHRRLLLRR